MPIARTARVLLLGGIAAGPLYVATALLQAALRPGFDLRRHPWSLLSNGELGWIQVANFLVTGTLVIAGAAGLARVVTTGRGRRWAPLMLGLYGLGLIGAGLFKADPGMGFPPGAPEQTAITGPGALHFVAGGFGFAGFIAACFIIAARFSSLGRRGWAGFSVLTGALFLAGFAGVASGSRAAVPYFALAVILGFSWLSLALRRLGLTRP